MPPGKPSRQQQPLVQGIIARKAPVMGSAVPESDSSFTPPRTMTAPNYAHHAIRHPETGPACHVLDLTDEVFPLLLVGGRDIRIVIDLLDHLVAFGRKPGRLIMLMIAASSTQGADDNQEQRPAHEPPRGRVRWCASPGGPPSRRSSSYRSSG